MELLAGRGAVVTGGASGIGLATARALLTAGLHVVVGDLEAQRSRVEGERCVFVPCDVTKREDLEALCKAAAALPCGGASFWFNNAGIGTEGSGGDLLLNYDNERWKLQQAINIHAVIEGTQLAYRHMKEQSITGPKFIVATASMAGLLPQAAPVYGSNKAAVIHFTRAMAVRAGLTGAEFDQDLRFYAVCPTFTETPLFVRPGNGAAISGIGGMAQAADIVDAIQDLLSKRPPSGAICRITLRNQGNRVVRDLMSYGKELGGKLPPREGPVLGRRTIAAAERGASESGQPVEVASSSEPLTGMVGRGAVITGAASGIGAAVARCLLDHGLHVVLGDLASQRDRATAIVKSYAPGSAIFVPCDVTKKQDLEALADAAAKLPCGGASIWLNNAGITTEGAKPGQEDLLAHPEGRKWRTQQAINFDAVIEGTQVAYRHMSEHQVRGDKFIISTASMAGLLPQASPVYCANKAGVNQFTRAMAVRLNAVPSELNKELRMYSICPTFTDTPLWRETDTKMTRAAIGGVAQVRDIVDAVLDLVHRKPPSGSICRITLRSGGRQVVRDLVAYGKELGGSLPARDGEVLGERTIGTEERAAAMRSRM